MNDGRQMGMHYMDNGFPYAVNESFGSDYFQGLTHVPVNYAFSSSIPDQVFVSAYNFFIFLFNFLVVFQFSSCWLLIAFGYKVVVHSFNTT